MQHAHKSQPKLGYGLLILILLLALSLRLLRIDAQSLWNDEGTSVALAARDLATITRGAAHDIHPPLYYYVLHFWIKLFGNSELAVRSLSALLGTALVLLTFILGRSIFNTEAGLIAAVFATLSPFQIYYSQETRMYMLSAFLAALSTYVWLRLLSRWQDTGKAEGQKTFFILVLYISTSILFLYTHYFATTVLVIQNLAFLWWLGTSRLSLAARRLPLVLRWVVVQMVIVVTYLPWLLLAREQLRVWPAISEPLSLTTLLRDLLCVFSLGLSAKPCPDTVLLGFAALLLVGMLAPQSRRTEGLQCLGSPTLYILCMLYLFVPIGIMYIISLQRPMYNPKFLLACTVPFHLFLAQGVRWLAGHASRLSYRAVARRSYPGMQAGCAERWLYFITVFSVILFVTIHSLNSLRVYYFDPRYARDDYRSIARYIEIVGRETDAILINAPGQIETFAYYYQGDLALYPLPRQRPLDKADTEAELAQMVNKHRRIFAILWATDESDPERFVEGWLDEHCYKATDSWYGNVRLVIYAVPAVSAKQRIEHPLSVNLANKVRLLGYSLLTEEVQPGDILQLTLFWEAIAPMNERYKVFTHVRDPYGHLVGQRDTEPGGGAKITTIWKEGEQIVDNYGVLILPATPPGEYAIEIGMYHLETGQRLPVIEDGQEVGDHIPLQSVRVLPAMAPPPISVLDMKRQINAQFAELRLLGYNLTKLGYEHQPDTPIRPGDVLHLTLFWYAKEKPTVEVTLLLQLRDQQGKVWAERQAQPTEGLYPTQRWQVGEIIRDQHNWFLPVHLPPQHYQIYLSVQRASDGQQIGPPLVLTNLTIQATGSNPP